MNIHKINGANKFLFWIIAILICLILIIGLFLYGNIFAFFLLFDSIVKIISTRVNIDIWIARIITILLGLIFINFVSPSIFSLNSKKRKLGFGIMGLIFILIFFGAYFVNRNFIFDSDGSPKKCIAWNPIDKCYDDDIPCNWKVHPKYGTEVILCSKKMIMMNSAVKNRLGRFRRITPNRNLRFFTPDGSPLIWYYQRNDGKLELFDNMGVHPQLQVALMPINRNIATLIIKYLEEKRLDMIIVDEKNGDSYSINAYNDQLITDFSALQELRSALSDLKR